MYVVVTHASSFDYQAEHYEPLRLYAAQHGHEIFLPHELGNVETATSAALKRADLVFAEVSLPSTSQGIELGYAEMSGVPILMAYRWGTRPSTSLRFLKNSTFFEYRSIDDAIQRIGGYEKMPNERLELV